MKNKRFSKILVLLMVMMMVLTMMPSMAWADPETENTEITAEMTDQDAVDAVYNFFTNHGSGNPIAFPYGTEEGQYTNAKTYMEAKIAELAPGKAVKMTISSMLPGKTSYKDYLNGGATVEYNAMDAGYNITPVYADGVSKPAVTGVTFTCGDVTSKKVTVYFAVDAIPRSEEEILDFEVSQLVFDYIKGNNKSSDYITQSLGKLNGNTVSALPTEGQIYKTGYSIKWELQPVSGKEDAVTMDAKYKTTITRPEVGEEDAVVKLIGTVYKTKDPTVAKSSEITVTVPAYQAITAPVKVTPADAKLTVKSGSTALDSKYIQNKGDGNYILTLHGTATDGSTSYSYTAEREGYITTSGKISANPATPNMDCTEINMVASGADDTALQSIEITSPAAGAPSILEPIEAFDKDKTAYTMKVTGPVASVSLKPTVATEGATVELTYFGSADNAKADKPTKKTVTVATACYLKDFAEETAGATVITIKVTAPASSTQSEKTRTYILTVTKNDEQAHSLKTLTIKPMYADGNKKSELKDTEYLEEEKLSPSLDANALADRYDYEVNAFCESVTLKPMANAAKEIQTITVNGETVASGKESSSITLQTGDNEIPIVVTKTDDSQETYSIHIYKKPQIGFTSVDIAGTETLWENIKTGTWTGTTNFPYDTENLTLAFNLEGADYLHFAGETRKYRSGETISLGNADSYTKTIFFCKEIEGKVYAQKYVISFKRLASSAPTSYDSYLPAPGQFVNLSAYYANISKTVAKPASGSCITLGAFGGNVVYYFADGITDDPNNPYGVDFIVYGNVFPNSDGSSAAGAAEPAAVMVSEDGENWYELAGSEYYNLNTERNVSITYTNPDKTFKSAVDVPWQTDSGISGYIYKNDYHKQAYYPQSSTYSAYQKGKTANASYTDDSVTFKGTLISNKEAVFGYADSHYADLGAKNLSSAVNPYRKNHLIGSNGDGFDLAWAVDENGEPVSLSAVHYVKIYTAMQQNGGATGEVSSEISGILKAAADKAAVGKTPELTKLTINGETVGLSAGKVVNYDAKDAAVLNITAEGSSTDNIYINSQRAESGKSVRSAVVDMVRIIVQNGEAEPTIYYIKVSGENVPAANAELEQITLSPGDVKQVPQEDGSLSFTVANNVERIALTADAMNKKASVTINGEIYASGESSKTLPVSVGENTFRISVTSENGQKTKEYTVKVTREQSAAAENTIRVYFSLTGDSLHGENGKHQASTWISGTMVTIPKGATVKYVTELMLNNHNLSFISDGVYVSEINGLAQFDNGANSGWMYRHNGKIADEGYAARTLTGGDRVEWFYTDDYTKETGYEGNWDMVNGETTSVTTVGASGSAITTAPTEVKVTEKTEADGTKVKVAEVTVSEENQKEILKQAKENKSAEIILNVTKDAVGEAAAAEVKLDKSFLESILKDTDAKLTIKTPFGSKTYTQEELKALTEATAGTTVTLDVKAEEDSEAAKLAQAKEQLAKVSLTARSVKTAKKNVKVTLKTNAKTEAAIKEIQALGYTVKYKFYRSTKKSSGYAAKLTKETKSYINTAGTKGKAYYYKARVLVYDQNGKLVAFSKLTQCKYASRIWTK